MIFSKTPPTPTETKRIVYLISWMVLGMLFDFLVYIFIETKYLNWALSHNATLTAFTDKGIWPFLHFCLIIIGAIGGYFLGKVWWRKVYIERYWEKKLNKLK
jgi:hypothetical protein